MAERLPEPNSFLDTKERAYLNQLIRVLRFTISDLESKNQAMEDRLYDLEHPGGFSNAFSSAFNIQL